MHACAGAATASTPVVFRQLYDAASSTYTYLLGCPQTKQALLIDPVLEQVRAAAC